MTKPLFQEDAYLRQCEARVIRAGDGAVVLDRTVFYPLGGGQQAGEAITSLGISFGHYRSSRESKGRSRIGYSAQFRKSKCHHSYS